MTCSRTTCGQCGHPLAWPNVRPLILADEDIGDNVLVCKDKGECRRRWWAEFAYKMALSQA